MMTLKGLLTKQQLPLKDKILLSLKLIRDWYESWEGDIYIAFSGGKDSTVLLYLVRMLYEDVPAVFNNTGLEFPEIVDFVRQIDNVIFLKPSMSFNRVINTYGYPVISKNVASRLYHLKNPTDKNYYTRRLILEGIKKDGTKSKQSITILKKKWRYLIDTPFGISDKCCNELKKKPAKKFELETGLKPMFGTLAEESMQRTLNYLKGGCNNYDSKRKISQPISFWTEQDIWQFLKQNNLKYSKIYDMGYTRTGCVFCMFGIHKEFEKTGTHRFINLSKTHPRLYEYCIEKLHIDEVLRYLNIPME